MNKICREKTNQAIVSKTSSKVEALFLVDFCQEAKIFTSKKCNILLAFLSYFLFLFTFNFALFCLKPTAKQFQNCCFRVWLLKSKEKVQLTLFYGHLSYEYHTFCLPHIPPHIPASSIQGFWKKKRNILQNFYKNQIAQTVLRKTLPGINSERQTDSERTDICEIQQVGGTHQQAGRLTD